MNKKQTKTYAVLHEEGYFQYYDSLTEAVLNEYDPNEEPVEIYESSLKSIGKYTFERPVKIKKAKVIKGKK